MQVKITNIYKPLISEAFQGLYNKTLFLQIHVHLSNYGHINTQNPLAFINIRITDDKFTYITDIMVIFARISAQPVIGHTPIRVSVSINDIS